MSGPPPSGDPPTALVPVSPVVLVYPTVGHDGPQWGLTEDYLNELRAAYPNLDVIAQCRMAQQWCIANRSKRKTVGGMDKFLVNWLNTATNRGGGARAPSVTPFVGKGEQSRQNMLATVQRIVGEVKR